jgi:hypothetical protein
VVVNRDNIPGAKVYWWVELRFKGNPLPPFKDWPTEADWPQR